MMSEDWFTNGYPDPEKYRELLRRRVVKLARLERISRAAPYRKGSRAHTWYPVYYWDVQAAQRELEAMS